MAERTRRTYKAKITNQSQVRDDLDALGFAASKLWNVARYYAEDRWQEDGVIPDDAELKAELKDHERYTDLHSQSSQRVFEELAEAFTGWYNSDDGNNPPGYRKHGDQHPRSTVSFKEAGFKHDAKHQQVRLSKGRNLKQSRSDFVLCEYEVRPDVEIENIQQVRAVYEDGRWWLHIVCRHLIDPDSPGDATAGIDLGICNYAAVAFEDEVVLVPGNRLKEDKHYFTQQEYDTEGENGPSNAALRARKKLARRRTHFLHALSKHIAGMCEERGVGRIAVGDLTGVREDDDADKAENWGRHGNKRLHGWEFDRFTRLLEYKAAERGIVVDRVPENGTSKTCSVCGTENGDQRVERGLYVCEECDTAVNADANGAENIRQTLTPSPSPDRSNGRLARPATRLFDQPAGRFSPPDQVSCGP